MYKTSRLSHGQEKGGSGVRTETQFSDVVVEH